MWSSMYFILLDMWVWGWIHQEGASFQNQTTLVNLGLFLAGCSMLLPVLISLHAFCRAVFLSYRPWLNFKGKHWYKSLEVSWWPLKKHLHFIGWAAFFFGMICTPGARQCGRDDTSPQRYRTTGVLHFYLQSICQLPIVIANFILYVL